MAEEIWKDIPGFPGYQASTLGNIRSNRMPGGAYGHQRETWKIIKPWYSSKQSVGSLPNTMVSLCRDARPIKLSIAYLVLLTFVSDRPVGMVACHYNDNRHDNRLENLRWDTRAGNERDAIRNGIRVRADRNTITKLTCADIPLIMDLGAKGHSTTDIANRFGVTHATIWAVLHGKTWRHITGINC